MDTTKVLIILILDVFFITTFVPLNNMIVQTTYVSSMGQVLEKIFPIVWLALPILVSILTLKDEFK